jgi:hypothetical protein
MSRPRVRDGAAGRVERIFDEWTNWDDWMMGFSIIEMYRDMASMNIFSSIPGGYPIMGTGKKNRGKKNMVRLNFS